MGKSVSKALFFASHADFSKNLHVMQDFSKVRLMEDEIAGRFVPIL